MLEDDLDKSGSGRNGDSDDELDTPFPPEALPAEVIKRLEEAGVIIPAETKRTPAPAPVTVKKPKAAEPLSDSNDLDAPTPPPRPSPAPMSKPSASPVASSQPAQPAHAPAQAQSAQAKSPPPPPPSKGGEIKSRLMPLLPNLQKLFRLMSGVIFPGNVSAESVWVDEKGAIFIGQLEIGRVFEGLDGDGMSVRLFFSKLNLRDTIPDAIRTRFPLSDGIWIINRSKSKFFIVTEKNISLGFSKADDASPFLFVTGTL